MDERIKYRNMWLQVLLTVVTLGLYAIYWFYATCKEMETYLGGEENVFLLTLIFGFPPLCLYSYYKQGEMFERISPDMNRWIIFILWIVFPPAVWLIIQKKLNDLASRQTALPSGSMS